MKKTDNPLSGHINNLFARDILDAIGDPVSIQDTDFRILFQNSRSKELIGDHTGEYCYSVFENKSGECEGCPLRITFREGNVCTAVMPHRGKSGLIFEITSSPVRDAGGAIIAGIEVTREISGRLKMQEDLRKFKFISDKASDGYLLVDRGARFHYVNEAACRMLGYSEKELMTLSLADVDILYDEAKYGELFDLAQHQTVPPVETRNKRKDGSVFFSETTLTGYKIDGETYIMTILRDITGRKSVEEAIRNISEGVSSVVGEKFFQSLTMYVNKILNADYTYIAEVLADKPGFVRTVSFIADGKIIDNLEVDIKGTPCETVLSENVCLCPSGVQSMFPHAHLMAEMNVEGYVGKLLYGSSGNKLGLIAVMYRKPVKEVNLARLTLKIFAARAAAEIERRQYQDMLLRTNNELEIKIRVRTLQLEKANESLNVQIDHLKIAQKSLQESEKRFRTAATCTADLIWQGDVRTDSLHWFGDIDSILGYELGEFPRTVSGHMENIHPGDKDDLSKSIQKSLDTGGVFRAEYRIRCKDGTYRYWQESGKPVEFENGKPVKWIGSVTDITERKQAEKLLYEKEEQHRNIIQTAIDGFWLVDMHGRLLEVNEAYVRMSGYSDQELLTMSISDLEVFESADAVAAHIQKLMAQGEDRFESRHYRKDGSIFDVEVSAKHWPERGRIFAFLRDITEYKQTERNLIESEHRYKSLAEEFNALLDAIPDYIVLLSPDLKILWANKAFALHVGRKALGMKGQHCYNLCCRIDSPCKNCPAIESFKTGKEETTRVMNTAGRIFNKRVFPIKSKSGEIGKVIEVTRDITAEVHMDEEAKLVQSRLIHTNKMTSLGTLVSGVAHEINNPNSYILNNTQVFTEIWEDAVKILADYYKRDKNLHLAGMPFSEARKIAPKLLYGINDGSLRIKHIIDNLRNFSRPDKARMDGKVDINTVIMTSTSILESQIKKYTVNYEVKCEDDLPLVKGSAQQIEQVIINLIMNALQSLPDKEAGITISTKHNKKTNVVEIKVADKGCGIGRKDLDHVTEPFFTTRFDIGGTGLGLSISDSIIREHNGSMIIKSKEGKGTVVTVKLPVYEGSDSGSRKSIASSRKDAEIQ